MIAAFHSRRAPSLPAAVRAGAMALLCAGLASCAALVPAMLLPPLAVKAGILGAGAAACAVDGKCEPAAPPCADRYDKTLAVTESPEIAIPADEGAVNAFAPAYWQSEFVSAASARGEQDGSVGAGSLVISDKAALFVPATGADGVRIPLLAVVDVKLQMSPATGAPRQMTVESCFGRLDRFTFGQKLQPRALDSDATAASAMQLKARVAALRSPAGKPE